ncbi:hypothetical protein GFS31_18150 [Leptolyngbya sp. BL0902]|nr:hypothetical protein GFS31_18150 [Leptolyngbya sp. BL0902]
MPLLWVLVVPFVVQVAGAVGVAVYLSQRSARQDLEQVAEQLREQTAQRIHADLDLRLQRHHRALKATYQLLQQSQWPVENEAQLRQILWRQMQLAPTLPPVTLGLESGLELGYGKLTSPISLAQAEQLTGRSLLPNTPFLIHRNPLHLSERYFSLVDDRGLPQEVAYTQSLPLSELTWYRAAQSLPRQAWSPIFSTHTTSQLSINALLPLRDDQGQFEGVLNSFLLLADISKFLAELEFSPTGQAFIWERSGALVASSAPDPPYSRDAQGTIQRLYAQESDDPHLRAVAQHLLQGNATFDHLPRHSHATLQVNRDVLYVDAQTYRDSYGLDWVLVLILPNADLMANVQANQRSLWLLWGGTLLASTGLGWLTARLIMAPLRQIAQASQGLAEGLPQVLTEPTAIAELAHLTDTFNRMAQTIQTSQADLNQSLAHLQTSESRFRKLLQSDVVGLLLTDLEGSILEANDYFLTLVGYDRQALEAGALRWDALTPPEYAEQDRRLAVELAQQGWISAFEKEYFHREGHRIPILIGGVMVNERETLCLAVDIRDRKRAERALKESRAFLQHITDASPNILYVYGIKERRNLYVSGAVQDILGYSIEDVLAMGADFFSRLLPPDQLARLIDDYAHLNDLADGETRSNELRICDAQGEPRWVFNRYTVFSRDADGRVASILGSVQDITVLKQSEAETQQLKDRLEFILATNPAAIFACSMDYTITFISQNIEGMVGYSPAEIVGWEGFWAIHIHPDDAERVTEELAVFFQQGHSVHEYRWRHRNGQYRWMRNELSLVRDAQGQPQEIVGYCIEISDRKQAEIQLQQTNEDLRRATRLKDEFLAAMSHELRTPLTAILGMTEGLLEEVFGPVSPQQVQALETVDRSGSHLLALINDILDVSKLESGQMTLDLTIPVDMVALCTASLAFVQPQAQAKAIHLSTQLPAALPRMTVDERRIRQVLINLLSNAVKFTPEGGSITLTMAVQPREGQPSEGQATQESDPPAYLCLSVSDTGIGIAEADQARVFDPFIQLDSALNRRYEGTGLGLGLVKRLVELHGGHIVLTSALGKGSCFTVYLPYAVAADLASASPTHPETRPPASPLIWLITADAVLPSSLSSYLRGKGYRVEVISEADLLATPQNLPPALVMVDTQATDGVVLIQTLTQTLGQLFSHTRSADEGDIIPIVALLGPQASPEEANRYLAAGAQATLPRPLRLRDVGHLVQHLVRERASLT